MRCAPLKFIKLPWVFQRFNLDIDEGGHTTVSAADAIKKSVDALGFSEENDNILICHLRGDRGGGGAVQSLFHPLIDLEVLHLLSTWTNCMLHALQKALEILHRSVLLASRG
jgi:hypothetical protein